MSTIKPYFFFLFFLFVTLPALAQQLTISGALQDSAHLPVAGAMVQLMNSVDKKVMYTAQSNNDGTFLLKNIDKGSYLLHIQRLAFNEYLHAINVSDTNISLPVIIMSVSVTTLKNVTVNGRKPVLEEKLDRTILNVENNVALTGATALDAVGKMPGIRVSNSSISLRGTGMLNVLLDDRLLHISGDDLINMLRSMPASEVVRIELIPNPPAKYDAGGSYGLINIVTKKKRQEGFSGSLNGAFTQAFYSGENGGVLLNLNRNRWNISTSLNGTKSLYNELTNPVTYYTDQTWDQHRKSVNDNKNILSRTAIDYTYNKRQLIGFTYIYSSRKTITNERSNTTIGLSKLDSLIDAKNNIDRHTQSHDFNLHYENKFDSLGGKFSMDGGYFTFNNRLEQFTQSDVLNPDDEMTNSYRFRNTAPQDVQAFTLQSDVNLRPRFVTFSFGGKFSYIDTKSGTNYYSYTDLGYKYDTTKSNSFTYKERIEALYVNALKNRGKWAFQVGLRAEYTQTTGISVTQDQTTKNNYLKLFPTVYIGFTKDKQNSFSFSYGKRINRPNYWYLNPFKQYISEYFYYEGNPYLQPFYNNTFQLNYIHNNMFITRIQANILNNVYDQILLTDEVTKVSRLTRQNYYSQRNYGINETVNVNVGNWWENSSTAAVYYIDTRSKVTNTASQHGWGADVSTSNTFYFNKGKTVMGGVDASYTFPQLSGVNKFDAYYGVDLGVTVLCYQKKLSLGLNATDIFRTMKTRFHSTVDGVTTYYNNYFDARKVRVSVSYKFGKTKTRQQSKLSNTEEKGRTY
ncbi:outer membrane beta-barrel protein [Chitinophaga sancti]|uniref:outer membrane beta-barrel protein n=1 Tax=Chitinophaga sancti TaxID=1004 RepID=UPI002A760D37|nr:outer membrane beta-barrel protein [Chitinophaga sancti]WPQ63176.1 outer membrane beta-barrel protein [Chitinophaga sancti]